MTVLNAINQKTNRLRSQLLERRREPKLEKLQDMTARIFLHEYDHMNGIDFTQRASRLALNIGMKKRDKILKRLEREGKLKKGEDGLYEVS